MVMYCKELNRKMTNEERRLKDNLRTKIRKQTPEYKEWETVYNKRPEVIESKRVAGLKYYYSETGTIQREKYHSINHQQILDKQKDKRLKTRHSVLVSFSKRMSNTNKPTCACCGLDDHIDFLSLDHIQGRKQMDNIKEITDIGYSSELQFYNLLVWIREHEYLKSLETQYFQVLCHNCNFAKGMVKNKLKCPHKHGDMK